MSAQLCIDLLPFDLANAGAEQAPVYEVSEAEASCLTCQHARKPKMALGSVLCVLDNRQFPVDHVCTSWLLLAGGCG